MAKNKKFEISLEEKLEKALVPVEEQPYKIPDNWVWTRLGGVIDIFRGLSYTKNDEVGDGYLVLRGNNLTDNGLAFLENVYVNEKVAEKGIKVKKDDIVLVASTGSSKVIGRACVAKEDYEKTTIGAFLLLCRPKENIAKNWVHYIFKTLRYRLYISEQAKGTNIKNIKNEYLENFYFPLPSLNEQKRIVEKLDFLFDKTKRAKEIIEEIKIDIENRKISILDRAFKGILTSKWRNENKTSDVKELLKFINDEKIKKWEEDCLQAEKNGNKKPKRPIIKEVEDMIVPVEEQPYKLPDNWIWVRLGEIINIFRGLSYTKNDEVENGYLVLRGNNLTDSGLAFLENIYVDEKVAKKGIEVKKDDIVLVASTGSSKVIGRSCVVEKDYEKTTIGAFLLLCRPKENIVKKWIHYIFKTLRYRLYISEQAKGTNIKNIKNEYLENFTIPLPSLEEQQEIVRILDEVLENENKVKELLELEERIDMLEKSILNKAFKGELGTKNSSDEPAIELLKKIL
ncbi:restriction endonuclease subunit S [uncultured Fusobacterium sp.]|uniref:restriction endonuclease subunit S n=1 Tax=uncultured Fusobacterium sp. TaxID=159267 RepID=UPI0025FB3F79|nr:restriction endonuclease subunit S [uncultured Fusobacterium sp.]